MVGVLADSVLGHRLQTVEFLEIVLRVHHGQIGGVRSVVVLKNASLY